MCQNGRFCTSRIFNVHSVEISGFFCHSDFTWNQFQGFSKYQNCHFSNCREIEFWFYGKFQSWKLSKWQFCNFWSAWYWFHVKSEWQKNTEKLRLKPISRIGVLSTSRRVLKCKHKSYGALSSFGDDRDISKVCYTDQSFYSVHITRVVASVGKKKLSYLTFCQKCTSSAKSVKRWHYNFNFKKLQIQIVIAEKVVSFD